ncbi:hypothetical protein [Schlesneria paludicola]|uniref:hypothetical protein n=1 Tax=Schlesneria paludicola TaxID=360056 RepID=UPI00029ADABA|nr:hypothetical protein [Schlesneria paludicola]
MNSSEMDRRRFHQLAMAALGGAIAGTSAGCGNQGGTKPAATDGNSAAASTAAVELSPEAEAIILDEPHVCRGLNTCKGQGRDKENSCAGQGTCASIANASCGGNNDCKGQGGCGANPGMNDCKGKGGCHIPLMEGAWETARTAFETAMKKHGKEFGTAPAKK